MLEKKPETSQRALSKELNVSLGALNYTLNALIEKGLIKAKNFRNNENRWIYAYILTPKGMREKGALTVRFLGRKMREYEALQREIDELRAEALIQSAAICKSDARLKSEVSSASRTGTGLERKEGVR